MQRGEGVGREVPEDSGGPLRVVYEQLSGWQLQHIEPTLISDRRCLSAFFHMLRKRRSCLFDDIFSELDDVFNHFYQIEQIASPPPRRREGKKSPVGQVCKVSDDGSKLAISLDVSKFKPDELKVNIDGRTLTVEGKQEVKEGSTYTARSFLRQWTVPEGVDVEQIRSSLTEDGHLAIEVPKPKPAITSRSIPIQRAINQPTEKSS